MKIKIESIVITWLIIAYNAYSSNPCTCQQTATPICVIAKDVHTIPHAASAGEYIIYDSNRVYDKNGESIAAFSIIHEETDKKIRKEFETPKIPAMYSMIRPPDFFPESKMCAEDVEGWFHFLYGPINSREAAKKKPVCFLAEVRYRGIILRFGELSNHKIAAASVEMDTYPQGAPSVVELKELAKSLLRHAAGEITLPVDRGEAGRRYEKAYARAHEKDMYDHDFVDIQWVRTDFFDGGKEVVKSLGITFERQKATIPNVNAGIGGNARLQQAVQDALNKKPGPGGFHNIPVEARDQAYIGRLQFENGSTSVHTCILYTYNKKQAMEGAYGMARYKNARGQTRCISDQNGENIQMRPDDIIATTEQAGNIGDRSFRLRALIGEEGLPVKGSEKRSIYFTRGNTAVAVWTENPTFNVLPAAREIDKLLVEGMRKAGEPLTREQDYLKEGKKQK